MNEYNPDNFIQLSGPLFRDVQTSDIFPDSKTFVDSIPKTDPEQILKEYGEESDKEHFNLKAFVYEHFDIPKNRTSGINPEDNMDKHIDQLWKYLSREPDEDNAEHSTLIPLPHPYIVPGGRFREIYYWDTYFTCEGLASAGHLDIVENLIRNFVYLIEEIGHVPNGNRQYYISRSQPPFLVHLLDLLARERGIKHIEPYLPALQREYAFWMDGQAGITEEGFAHRRIVRIDESTLLNRYWDDRPKPREESFKEDYELGKDINEESAEKLYRHIRAGAESGWDFTSRWFRDESSIKTIRTTDILPVDLNSLLYFMEQKLADWLADSDSDDFQTAAEKRYKTINTLFWDDKEGFYFDYHWPTGRQTEVWSLAGVYPLFMNIATDDQAKAVADVLENKFLKDGGLVSTLHRTGQQWDFPNGWAPLQWVAVKGLLNYGYHQLAQSIAARWIKLNEDVFQRTGKMMEKYNVVDLTLEAGGGEYPLQDGFGWTNGVAVAFKKEFGMK